MRFVIASNNTKKTDELRQYFKLYQQDACNYRQLHPQIMFPTETTDNMRKNALQKAQAVHDVLPNEFVLADDSALFVPAIPNHFGVTTKREFDQNNVYSDQDINDYILKQLSSNVDRAAYLESDMVLIYSDGRIIEVQARGGLSLVLKGQRYAHGIDDILLAENGLTLGQMSLEERAIYSHRGRAVKKIQQLLKNED